MPLIAGSEALLRYWDNPVAEDIPADPIDFLRKLGGPTVIRCNGQEGDRKRVVSALLHGNEPSSVLAIHQLLRSGLRPRVNVDYIIVCVNTALSEPIFSFRYLPHLRDMNRCFREPFNGAQGKLASLLLDYLRDSNAEAIIDIHNTSGNGPAFSICTRHLARSYDVASLFTHRLILNHIRLGALMEFEGVDCPVVTIECGGAADPEAHAIALRGLKRFVNEEQLFHRDDHGELDLYYHPVRLELQEHATLEYADTRLPSVDVTLPRHIDQLNFGVVTPQTPLAWLRDGGFDGLRVADENGKNVASEYFRIEGRQLYPAVPLKLFMVTTNPLIARTDCILYAVKETDHRSLHK